MLDEANVSMTDDWDTVSGRNVTVLPTPAVVVRGTESYVEHLRSPINSSNIINRSWARRKHFATVTQIESLGARMKVALEKLEDKWVFKFYTLWIRRQHTHNSKILNLGMILTENEIFIHSRIRPSGRIITLISKS